MNHDPFRLVLVELFGFASLLALVVTLSSCSSGLDQTDYCYYEHKRDRCMTREELAKQLTYLPSWGDVKSIDEGPFERVDHLYNGTRFLDCCYVLTYKKDAN